MMKPKTALAVIPSQHFRWRARVRFVESFQTRAAALNYAFQHNCNLIVERKEGNGALFDVMQDPDGACTAGLNFELLTTEEILVEPPAIGWTRLMLSSLWHLSRDLATALAALYVRGIVPLSRWTAGVASPYLREVEPTCRRAAAAVAALYVREAAPRVRLAASWFRQADLEGMFRRAWNRGIHSRARRRFTEQFFSLVSKAAGSCAHLVQRLGSIGIQCTRKAVSHYQRTAVAVEELYLREVAPRVHQAASRFQRVYLESTLCRKSPAVVATRQSNASRLR